MAVAVAFGAFGAHALKKRLDDERLKWWETGSRYHMVHSLGLFAVALAERSGVRGAHIKPYLTTSGWLLVAGIILFSGSLYLMALTAKRKLGMITPLGGLCWILGWLSLANATYPY